MFKTVDGGEYSYKRPNAGALSYENHEPVRRPHIARFRWAVGPLGRWAVGPLGRWAVGPLGRWAVGPVLVAAGLLITPHEAHAGQWRLATSSELAGKANCQGSNEYSGTSTGHADAIVGIPGTSSSGTGPSDAVDTSVTWGIPGSGSNPMPQTVAYPSCNKGYAHFKGKVRAWFVYVPNPLKDANGRPKLDAQGNPVPDPNDKPGDTLNVLATATGTATASDGGVLAANQATPPNTRYITNPKAYTASVSIGGQTGTSHPDPYTGNAAASTATLYVRPLASAPTNGAVLVPVPGPWCDFDVSADVTQDARFDVSYYQGKFSHQGNVGGSATARGNYSASPDLRSVIVTRAGATGQVFTTGSGTSVTTGDTLFAFKTSYNSLQGKVDNPQTISAIPNSLWSAGSTWTWATAATGDTKSSHVDTAPLGSLTWNGSSYVGTPSSPSTTTITYTITDPSDGAVGTATYKLTYHDEIELLSDKTGIVNYDTDYFDGGGHPQTTTGPATTSGSYGQSQSTSNGFIFGATVGGLEKFSAVFGFSGSWEHSHTSGVALTPPNSGVVVSPGFFVNLVIRHNYNRHHAIFYKYDVNGRVQRFSVKTSPATEIPQEGFEDEYSNDEVRWSSPKGGILGTGFPTPSTPQPTKPPAPSYSYS